MRERAELCGVAVAGPYSVQMSPWTLQLDPRFAALLSLPRSSGTGIDQDIPNGNALSLQIFVFA